MEMVELLTVQETPMFISVLYLEGWKWFIQSKWRGNTFQAISMESFLRKKVLSQQINWFPKTLKMLARSPLVLLTIKILESKGSPKGLKNKLDDPNSNRKASLPTSQKEINHVTIKI